MPSQPNGTSFQDLIGHSVLRDDAELFESRGAAIMYFSLPAYSGYSMGGILPPDPPLYWSISRDNVLRATVLHEALWASAVEIAGTKVASLSWEAEGDFPRKVKRAQEMMLGLSGKGWVPAQSMGVRDYLTTDNGEWWEIVRAGSSVGSKILGLMHLDSLRCLRTGDPDRPAYYRDLTGRYHELRDYQVINLTDMPSPGEEWLGVGLCAASRAYPNIYEMSVMQRYVNEKIAGGNSKEIHMVSGINDIQLTKALQASDAANAQRGAVYYKGVTIIPMLGNQEVKGYRIPIAEIPEGFERKQEFDLAVTVYADAIGLDQQDLQPLSGQGLGTGTQSYTLMQKAKGKGLAARQKQWVHEINDKVFPDGISFVFIEKDLDDEKKRAEVSLARAQVRSQMQSDGVISMLENRQLAVDDDDLPKEFTPPEGDVTPEDNLDDEEKPLMAGELLEPLRAGEIQSRVPELPLPKPPVAQKSVNEVLREFTGTLTRWVVDAANGNMDALDVARSMRALIRRVGPEAYKEGLREGGVEGDDEALDEDDDAAIDKWLGEQVPYVTDFAKAAGALADLEGDDQATARKALLDRVDIWEQSVRTAGSLGYASAKANMMVTWRLGDTEQNCATCKGLNGKRHRLKWFVSRGLVPQQPGSSTLKCAGFNCDCRLVDGGGATVMP